MKIILGGVYRGRASPNSGRFRLLLVAFIKMLLWVMTYVCAVKNRLISSRLNYIFKLRSTHESHLLPRLYLFPNQPTPQKKSIHTPNQPKKNPLLSVFLPPTPHVIALLRQSMKPFNIFIGIDHVAGSVIICLPLDSGALGASTGRISRLRGR